MEKVLGFIERYQMIVSGDKIVAGISGGADSVCLLFVLLELREKMGIEIVAVHVNHGLRGENAKRDEVFVQELCRKQDVKCVVYHENVESISKKRKQSVEEAGRVVRREAFERTLLACGGTKIAMAHHQNDNAETLLMNLARGTGLKGLGGIQPVAGNIIRPLLCLNRREIERFVEEIGCGFCQDETNEEDDYTRNRLRHQVIPVLEEQVNAQAVRHMNEAMEQIRGLQDYMEMQTEQACQNCVAKQKDGSLCIYEAGYRKLHRVLQGLLIRRCLSRASGAERDITMAHVEAVAGLFEKQTGRSRDLPYSVKAVRNYDGVVLKKKTDMQKKGFAPIQLRVPGITRVPELNLTICCSILEKQADFSAKQAPQKTYTKWFDYDIIKGDLIIRPRQGRDSIVIDKDGRSQKIKSYFINEKIPSEERDCVPLIADEKQIIWILGYRMSSACQITVQTHRVLEIKVTEEKSDVREDYGFSIRKRS
ncbi:tRNA lysidine(34) synthetase TilS [Muricomes sp. OA1]|uniref:tRNA(Ile)-lysidine synthase n=1 Tax=Hungatella hathewayi TaxID=154046 RepID=A0A3E2X2F6_9FIRM|nr:MULTISPECIES: tRNA lysidine(34) synthetase TilS [Clostridia]MCH1971591.1 tRNA lysidine(34) synthetase TilS [Muricomes sp. OA1]RGC35586.1 tRNA lysidine(34) synthetase TilS [Hungatella hathewayi]GKH34893.1 tRNA(Ile)-lysidine synthase [Faecalicatena contorta]